MIRKFKVCYTEAGGVITAKMRWDTTESKTYVVYRQIGIEGDIEEVASQAETAYQEIISEDGVYIYWVVDDAGDVSEKSFVHLYADNSYSKELKGVLTTLLKIDTATRAIVEGKVYFQSQPVQIKTPYIIFSINEYATGALKGMKDITIPVMIYSRDKTEFDKLRNCVSNALEDYTYCGKAIKLHHLQEIGGKAESLSPEDKLTWSLEFNYKGRIEIPKL